MANGKRNTLKQSAGGALDQAMDQAVQQVEALIRKFVDLGLVSLTAEDRLHSNGRMREGEPAAIAAVLDAIDARPGLFAALAARDRGGDDQAVETGPTRAALARRNALAPVLGALEKLTQLVSDDLLASGQQVKEVSLPAYALIKANAALDPVVQRTASAALDFYGAPARARAAKGRKAAKPPRA